MSEKKFQSKGDKKAFSARLEQIREWERLSKQQFCEIIGYSQVTSYNAIVGGHKLITLEKVAILVDNFPLINLNWLVTGEGEMLLRKGSGKSAEQLEKENKLLKEKILKMEGVHETYKEIQKELHKLLTDKTSNDKD